jgi:hypothetical protein
MRHHWHSIGCTKFRYFTGTCGFLSNYIVSKETRQVLRILVYGWVQLGLWCAGISELWHRTEVCASISELWHRTVVCRHIWVMAQDCGVPAYLSYGTGLWCAGISELWHRREVCASISELWHRTVVCQHIWVMAQDRGVCQHIWVMARTVVCQHIW